MPELLRLLQAPGLEALVLVFAAGFLAVRLGHAVIGLLDAWEDYRAKRVRRLGKTSPPG